MLTSSEIHDTIWSALAGEIGRYAAMAFCDSDSIADAEADAAEDVIQYVMDEADIETPEDVLIAAKAFLTAAFAEDSERNRDEQLREQHAAAIYLFTRSNFHEDVDAYCYKHTLAKEDVVDRLTEYLVDADTADPTDLCVAAEEFFTSPPEHHLTKLQILTQLIKLRAYLAARQTPSQETEHGT